MTSTHGFLSVICVAFLAATLLAPSVALAQTKAERVTLSLNGASQTGMPDVSGTVGFTENAEKGSFTYKFPVKQGPAIDVGGRIRLVRNFGISVGYTGFSAKGTADITGQVPHPFFFNQPRVITGEAPLERKETAVHVRATLSSSPGKKLQFTISAGPTFFSAKQGLVDSVSYTDSYPYDTASFGTATTKQVSQSKTGFGAGADVAYFFSASVGVGVIASIAKTTISATAADSSTVSIDIGGTSFGIGLRLRF